MIKIGVDGVRPQFWAERQLRVKGADVYRGKDGTMTIILPDHAEVASGNHRTKDYVYFVLSGYATYRFKKHEWVNKEGYLDDRRTL